MVQYIWQAPSWPDFRWDSSVLLRPIGKARQAQGKLLGESAFFELELQAEVLTEEAFTTAAIEGYKLNRDAVRSSVARRLGLPTAGLPATERHVDGLVGMLVDATRNYGDPLAAARLKGWQAALFPTGYSGMSKIVVGDWRRGEKPMQVISGPIGKEKVHYEAPPADDVEGEVERFLEWFRSSRGELDGLVRAAVAHFWFVTIHPFQDGNGRIARAIADMALAQDENNGCRLYSMSAQIKSERDDYYEILERTQKGNGDITEWIVWFLECLERAIRRSDTEVLKTMNKARLWQNIAHFGLNERQRKVVNRLFEAGPGGFKGGLTNLKYRGITKTTRETAKRDMADLVAKGILVRNPGGGRSVSYDLVWPT
ncbi:MAG: Fic family protein [Pseudomonadota bacterium]